MDHAPLDPEVAMIFASLGPRVPLSEVSAEKMRADMRAAVDSFTRDAEPISVAHVTDDIVPGRHGDIRVRVYRPDVPTAVVVFMHGGSWIAGDIETSDLVTRRISRDTGAVVVSVDYRMLPEHPFPAPLDDTYDAVVWARAMHPDVPLIVAGDSAGGTLSACVALRSRDERGPRIDGQVLIYPAIDDDIDTPSMVGLDARLGDRRDLAHVLRQYASTGAAVGSPYAVPGRAASLAHLPPAIMVIPGHDGLRSAEEEYVSRLREAGVPVVVQLDLELAHSWIDYAPRVAAADRAFTRLTDHINKLIGDVGASR
ncbi:alpha/beta hydrolase [Aeromicrobium endophyticum]|nr:alpha/beta hydrolase [Aeromicrobium endophyticum]